MRARLSRRWLRWTAIGLCAVAAAFLADYIAYPLLVQPGGRSANRGENGLWLRYTWYFGRHSDDEVRELAHDLRARQIRYAYFHVREVTARGHLRYRYPAPARKLMATLHREAPEVKAIAWIYAGNTGRRSECVELAKPEVRAALVSEARRLVTECGFDGVQWDYEVCANGDPHFLALLDETRAALPRGKLLSVAAPMWQPKGLERLGWSSSYFAEVARHCDQVAVMCYDSGVFWPRGYVALVRAQAAEVTAAVAKGDPHCRVLLGLPTYGRGGASHQARAENLRLALKGVREGLPASAGSFAGISLFADYTTEPEEWREYEKWWLER